MHEVKPRVAKRQAVSDLLRDLPEVSLKDRNTQELVIALVGPVGAGVTTTAKILKDLFANEFDYTVAEIRVSTIIEECAELLGRTVPGERPLDEHIRLFQDLGTKLREKFGEAYLAAKCVERIAVDRDANGGYDGEEGGERHPIGRRRVHIIDSLKNPAELQRLREVYDDRFWIFGVFAPEQVRRERLKRQGLNLVQIEQIFEIDQEEGVDHGQRVRQTIHHADFFVRNDGDNEDTLVKSLQRYLDLLFGVGVHTPTQDESAMYEADSGTSKSACLSRQVGAAIYSEGGELIGIGTNDVPRKGGGLYTERDGSSDNRCYKWQGKICHNDDRKGRLYRAIYEKLRADGLLVDTAKDIDVERAVERTDVRNLIEYSRAVHAEMEAIVSVARGHKAGIAGATMYTTTFPCHSCARHIVAAGISRVIYIEPYAKSLATVLHADSISELDGAEEDHVLFLQYEGVAPKNMLRLFKSGLKRKDAGHFLLRERVSASPVFPSPLDGFYRREMLVLSHLVKAEEPARAAGTEDHHGDEEGTQGRHAVKLALDLASPGSDGGGSPGGAA